ncbi:hypothetical protein CaldiYA01_24370 (plasmid) [Caldicellulosiruptor diazotrophicus]|uniref:Uncharacterized protein n=1 Tax=Caldicellulosiruptor diazotrophicus TaxID=2806205 RepID=A0ABN6EAA9_9FIRM|nr:hypothetical protein CaldiYA01_24370 [Caldicellulosiruptor diazotrophicus]
MSYNDFRAGKKEKTDFTVQFLCCIMALKDQKRQKRGYEYEKAWVQKDG